MPTLRKDEYKDIDFGALDEATYSDAEFAAYDGPIPEGGTILDAYIKKLWWTRTNSRMNGAGEETGNKPMIKILAEAGGNQDGLEEFDGLPFWENAVMTPDAKFRWGPLFEVFGLSPADIKKMRVGEADNVGLPIERIGTLEPGTDGAWCRVVTKVGYDQSGEPRAEVRTWLPFDDEDIEDLEPEDLDEPEDEDEETGEEYDEDDTDIEDEDEDKDEDEEPEPEPEPARPTRAARGRTSPAPARGGRAASGRTAAAPARSGRSAAPAAAPARSGKPAANRTAAPAPARSGARSSTARSGRPAPVRTRRPASGDEPPF